MPFARWKNFDEVMEISQEQKKQKVIQRYQTLKVKLEQLVEELHDR